MTVSKYSDNVLFPYFFTSREHACAESYVISVVIHLYIQSVVALSM